MEQKTQEQKTTKPLTMGTMINNTIVANEEISKNRNSSIRLASDFLSGLVARAKKKYPELSTHDNSVVKAAIVEIMRDDLIDTFASKI